MENCKQVLRLLSVGERTMESFLIRHGLNSENIEGLVQKGYLVLVKAKDPSDFMSENYYCLTESGRDFAWK